MASSSRVDIHRRVVLAAQLASCKTLFAHDGASTNIIKGVYVFFKNKDAKSEPVTTANLHTNDKTYEETGLRENTAQVPQSGVSHSNMV